VATPCPLILAAPIALISGVSRAARFGIIVKGATAIERLGEVRTVLLDKTGTLTTGAPEIERVVASNGVPADELLRLAASLDQLSAHVLAEAIVHEAEARGLVLSVPSDVTEEPGAGIAGTVDGRTVAVGSSGWIERRNGGQDKPPRSTTTPGRARVLVGVDGRHAGAILLSDRLRPEAPEMVRQLRDAGAKHVAMVTGDDPEVAETVAREAGLDRVYSDLTPEAKLDVVRAVQAQPELRPVLMVGDGVNDAPALALADVGIAMGSAGATVSSETADVVIAVDRIDRVVDALRIGRRSLGIARQSVLVGIGLSLVAMAFAAFGYIPPVAGALLQEGIDVAVILNALRALRG
jgi:heavy metal translocating P-type ATPase